MKIHPVFHVSLLDPYTPDPIPGRSQPPPLPVITAEGEEEYEVNEILKSRRFRGTYQYFVDWKGYPPSERSWVSWRDMENAEELVKTFHSQFPNAVGPRKYRS